MAASSNLINRGKNKNMKNLITFDKFAKVFTVLGLVALIAYGVVYVGNVITIIPTNELEASYFGSLEADAEYHALKAQGQKSLK
jgi:hypothetical protein